MAISPHTGAPARILVVDDEPIIRDALERVLTDEGWLVEQAPSGLDALERCRREHFDALVLDQNMPGLTGIDVARELLHDGFATPIIIFSAIFGNELTAECARLGLLTIDKVDWHALVDCCRAAVEQSAPRRRRQLASRKPALSQT